MILRFLLFFSALLVFSQASHAGRLCYSADEAEAEQGIRIHSELMVIGLNCQHIRALSDTNVYMQYRQMTKDHGDLFARYEQILLDHYQKEGIANPEANLNLLRTRFANKISNDAAGMRPDLFCLNYVPRIHRAAKMNRSQIRSWASTLYNSHPVSRPLCAGVEMKKGG